MLSLVLITAQATALLAKTEGHRSTGTLEVNNAFLKNRDTGTAAAMAMKDRKVHDDNDEPMPPPSIFLGWFNLPIALAGFAYAELKPHIPRVPGVVLWSCAVIILFLMVAGKQCFDRAVGPDEDEATGDEDKETVLDLDDWKQKADNGDLDLYTCIALSCGRYKLGIQTFKLIPQLIGATIMQLLVGVLLLLARFPEGFNEKTLQLYPMRNDFAFRLAGALLYAYAAHGLLHAMHDVCRGDLLNFFFPRTISWFYEFPLLLGEFMNVFVGLVLQVILFVIFCKSKNAEDLTMNCLAVQFLCEIDNQLVSDAMEDEAIANLKYALIEWTSASMKESHHHHSFQHNVQVVVMTFSRFLKGLFMVMAVGLTLTFGFSNEPYLCDLLKSVEPYPWCLGV